MNDDPFICCGCGKPLDLGEYRSCDCPTGVAFKRGTDENLGKKNRCAWCSAIPTLANLDGEDLCRACCDKWARAEGLAQAETAE
jgi:hypothetical protein